ncbi:MAG: hypothetical protein WAP03_12015 [Methylorubrum rhodinum]|uniref:hypothetical protein n=1 Tax=Methylorubrum rhodinum TaxID=29428 RepID=UPI003BAE95AC
MNVHLHRRAEIAFRSLREDERRRVSSVLRNLESTADLAGVETEPGSDLSIVPVGPELRLILSLTGGAISVDDIVPSERVERIVGPSQV